MKFLRIQVNYTVHELYLQKKLLLFQSSLEGVGQFSYVHSPVLAPDQSQNNEYF